MLLRSFLRADLCAELSALGELLLWKRWRVRASDVVCHCRCGGSEGKNGESELFLVHHIIP